MNFEAIVREALLDLQRVPKIDIKSGSNRRPFKRQRITTTGPQADVSSSSNQGQTWGVKNALMLDNTKRHWNFGSGSWLLIAEPPRHVRGQSMSCLCT